MKIPSPLPTTMIIKEVLGRLDMSRQRFSKSGLSEFLTYYQEPGQNRSYLIRDVTDFEYWLMVRRGMIAIGHWGATTSRLLPPGETMQEKRYAFEAWLEDDPHGATCPQCDGPAVQGNGQGAVWCEACGISPAWKMDTVEQLHIQAMDLAEEAFAARQAGNEGKALMLFDAAIEREKEAVSHFPAEKEAEPTRSILYRSAASMAYHAKDYEQGEQLVALALDGYPPAEIKRKLEELQEINNGNRKYK